MAPSSCPLLLENRALIDSLGYIDTEYNSASSQQQVQAQIRAEMATFSPPKDKYLAFLPPYSPSFGGRTRLQIEFKRVSANVALNAIDTIRYQVSEPTGKQAANLETWEQAVKQLQVAVEHQNNWMLNLELQQGYGTKLAKVRTAVMDGMNRQYDHMVQETKTASNKINLSRQQEQLRNMTKLLDYQSRYNELLVKNACIKRACVEKERQQQKKLKTA
ncbi:hypothetical protein KXD40_008387 [Peronospora effusa]|uniref:Pre-mRNA-splicing factor SPF27 n=1 Tax=Peronospora effusa TaxID=542832 RepID=A0A3M6VHQ2_9STRA|nr:hypothetical protein DD238_003108 [Peronospora effusa]RQM15555.1 hypothetical protein DD237_003871 [Peronospora effusa]UIZ24451.1 hypothetical protein KXD40_008387 [Peronospora effusa]